MYYIYVFYVLGIKPNAWTYISGIKLKSLTALVPPHNPPNINIYNSNWNIELFGRCGIFSFPIVSSV